MEKIKKREKVKQINCIDQYNRYIHTVEEQIKLEEKVNRRIKEKKNVETEKKEYEMK